MGEKELKGEEEEIEKEEKKTENEQQRTNGWEEILGKALKKISLLAHSKYENNLF